MPIRRFLHHFIHLEVSGGIALGLATILALFLANTPLHSDYQNLLNFSIPLGPIHFSFLHLINDGLMTIFFFFVCLEIKGELI